MADVGRKIMSRKSNPRPQVFTHAAINGLQFGVLRRRFSGTNNAVAYGFLKLHPATAGLNSSHRPWVPTAQRVDILLPEGSSDLMSAPAALLQSFEDFAGPGQKDLLLHIKLQCPPSDRLHVFWERARRFARARFVEDEKLPVILVLHVPAARASCQEPGAPHVHMLVLARQLNELGWGATTKLARDEARFDLAAAWAAQN